MNLCEWKITDADENTWESECGLLWQFMDGSPTDNGIVYCPRCGREMVEIEEVE